MSQTPSRSRSRSRSRNRRLAGKHGSGSSRPLASQQRGPDIQLGSPSASIGLGLSSEDEEGPDAVRAAPPPEGVDYLNRRHRHRRRHRHGSVLASASAPLLDRLRVALRRGMPRISRRHSHLALVSLVGCLLGVAVLLGLYFGLEQDDNVGPVIDLGYASYRGTDLGNGVSQFLGMRYARPPTGNLRWRAPVPPALEEDIQKAKEFRPICLGISEAPSHYADEDCLFANVWSPTNATADMKLPVLVFVQGGGYTRNANANWNGTELVLAAERDLVLVNFNYRVGLWGFLAGAEVAADGALNAGMLDQRLLLHWVQQHIPSFGGDPAHVVIHGVSAGAGSVALHLAAYGGRNDGLFHAAISESTFIPAHPPVRDLEYQLDQTMDQAGCAGAENRMACLRSRTKDQLQSLNVPAPFPGRDADPLFYWTPCVDGDFMQKNPAISFAEGSVITVPALFGTCSNEGSTFAPSDAISSNNLTNFFEDNLPEITPDQSEAILEHYPLEPAILPHSSWFPSISRAYGEAIFICPSYNILNAILSKSNTTKGTRNPAKLWSYRYNVIDDTSVVQGHGVPHVFEVAAVFGPDMLSYPAPASYYTYNAGIVPVVQSYIASFARTFDPNIYKLDTAPMWLSWDENQLRMLLQTGLSAMEVVEDDERSRCEFWKDLSVTMNQ